MRDWITNSVVGGFVTIALLFTGISALLGGAVAGYRQREDRKTGIGVGVLSVGIGTALIPPLFLVLGQSVKAAERVAFSEVFVGFFLINIALGAIGGYLGVVLYRRNSSTDSGSVPA